MCSLLEYLLLQRSLAGAAFGASLRAGEVELHFRAPMSWTVGTVQTEHDRYCRSAYLQGQLYMLQGLGRHSCTAQGKQCVGCR